MTKQVLNHEARTLLTQLKVLKERFSSCDIRLMELEISTEFQLFKDGIQIREDSQVEKLKGFAIFNHVENCIGFQLIGDMAIQSVFHEQTIEKWDVNDSALLNKDVVVKRIHRTKYLGGTIIPIEDYLLELV